MSMNRRGFFGRIGAALAGCVLANTPLAGKLFDAEALPSVAPEGLESLIMNSGDVFGAYRQYAFEAMPGIRLTGIAEIEPPVSEFVQAAMRGAAKQTAEAEVKYLYGLDPK